MKRFYLFILMCAITVSSHSQDITLKMENTTVKEAIMALMDITDYTFIFSSKDINSNLKISLNLQNATIEVAVAQLLTGQDSIDYEIKGKQIIFKKRYVYADPKRRKIAGLIITNNGEPIVGAGVFIKDSSIGTVSNIDGEFSLDIPLHATLQISYIGYETQHLSVSTKSFYTIILNEDIKSLDEIVVIGYESVKRKDLVGSVASIQGSELLNHPVPDIVQALQGQLSGVSVTSQDGRPGAINTIRVRGWGSITQGNNPLVLIDGIQGDLESIPLESIESIEVLKDAASTAIYGARGANGIILVSTKVGTNTKTQINYNSYYQLKTKSKTLPTMDAYNYVLWNWAYANSLGDSPGSYGDSMAKYFGLGSDYGNNLNRYSSVKTHNYINDVLETASTWNHDLSLTGGGAKNHYLLDINYLKDNGVRINSGYRRFSTNFKYSHEIFKDITIDLDLRYTQNKLRGAQLETATSSYSFKPIDSPFGDVSAASGFGQGDVNVLQQYDPVSEILNFESLKTEQHMRSSLSLNCKILPGLTGKLVMFGEHSTAQNKEWQGVHFKEPYSKATLIQSQSNTLNFSSIISYNNNHLQQKNKYSLLFGYEILSTKSKRTSITGAGYPLDFTMDQAFARISMTNPSIGLDSFFSNVDVPNNSISFFGRFFYSLKNKYLMSLSLRSDGSSKFAKKNRWALFPSIALAWRISDEDFMSSYTELFDILKFRLSYGVSGSDNIESSLWYDHWKSFTGTIDGFSTNLLRPNELKANPDLKWEKTVSRNIGADFAFMNNKFYGNIDLYWNTTNDILMKLPINVTSGFSYQYKNAAKTSNRGVDLTLNYDVIRKKNFNLTLRLVYSYNKNNIDRLAENALSDVDTSWGGGLKNPKYDYVIREGSSIGSIWGYKSQGYYSIDDFDYINGIWYLKPGISDTSKKLLNYPKSLTDHFNRPKNQTAFPGMLKFQDTNKDRLVDTNDAVLLAETLPKHVGGLNFLGNIKSFDFNLGFTYQLGGHIYNATAMHSLSGGSHDRLAQNRLKFVENCFKVYTTDANGNLLFVNTPNELRELNRNARYGLNMFDYGVVTSQFIENASYLRLNLFSIGYSLPSQIINKYAIQKLRLYFAITNLFCLTGYSGLDPDVNTVGSRNGFPMPNYDYNAYPKTRTYTLGLNLRF